MEGQDNNTAAFYRSVKGSRQLILVPAWKEYETEIRSFAEDPERHQKDDELTAAEVSRGAVFVSDEIAGKALLLRPLKRGGLVRFISERTFVRSRLTRAEAELMLLSRLLAAGIAVVRPVAAYIRWGPGRIYYRASLITEFQQGAHTLDSCLRNFSELDADENAAGLLAAARDAGTEAARCLQMGVFHSDLHPGNILLSARSDRDSAASPDGQSQFLCLIDFDKAVRFQPGDLSRYIAATAARWNRFLEKYRRPLRREISAAFCNAVFAAVSGKIIEARNTGVDRQELDD